MAESTLEMEDSSGESSFTQDTVFHDDKNFTIAERMVRRRNLGSIDEIINSAQIQARNGGIFIALTLLLWWIIIYRANDDLSIGISILLGLNFYQVAILVMILSVVAALMSEASQERGSITNSSLAGGIMIFSGFYVFEPLITSILVDSSLQVADGLWRTLRLGGIWAGMSFGMIKIIKALHLNWLIRFCDENGFDMAPNGSEVLRED